MKRSATYAERVAELLRDEGFRAKVRPDGSIASGLSGLSISVTPDEDSIQLSCAIFMSPQDGFNIREANEYNKTYRFAKIFIDDEDDLILVTDFPFDPAQDGAGARLMQLMTVFDGSIRFMRDAVVQARNKLTSEKSTSPQEAVPKRGKPLDSAPKRRVKLSTSAASE